MSVAANSVGEVPIASQPGMAGLKKRTSTAPANRLLVAKSDLVPPPEPR